MRFIDWRADDLRLFASGSDRVVEPAVTLDRVLKFAPAMGITRLANITGLDRIGIPVSMACRPNSRSVAVSMGKGLTLESAMVSALMEAVEGFHGESANLPVVTQSLSAFRDGKSGAAFEVVDTDLLQQPEGNLFTPEFVLPWTVGTNVITGREVWLPHELVHTDYRVPFPTGWGCFTPSSNGLASGNVLSEAVIHALCEIIERDCIWRWDNASNIERSRRRIDLASIVDEKLVALLTKLRDADLLFGIWDITSDLNIPAYMSWIVERASGTRGAMGSGCDVRPETALARAITEAAQCRLTIISGARDDLTEDAYFAVSDESESYWKAALTKESMQRSMGRSCAPWSGSSASLVDHLLEAIARSGYNEVVVVDLTNSQFNIPVVRIVIPGMMVGED